MFITPQQRNLALTKIATRRKDIVRELFSLFHSLTIIFHLFDCLVLLCCTTVAEGENWSQINYFKTSPELELWGISSEDLGKELPSLMQPILYN